MNDKKIILLNGPAGSGKDHAAKYLQFSLPSCRLDKFARVLKERTHAMYGFDWRPWDYYENCKEIPNEDFLGLTPRQAYIAVSETYFKPQHGERVFGKFLADELDKFNERIVPISDSGFVDEARVLIDKYGCSNVILIRIYREGYTFSRVNDSRDYIYLPEIENFDVYNMGDETFTNEIMVTVKQWFSRDPQFCKRMKNMLTDTVLI